MSSAKHTMRRIADSLLQRVRNEWTLLSKFRAVHVSSQNTRLRNLPVIAVNDARLSSSSNAWFKDTWTGSNCSIVNTRRGERRHSAFVGLLTAWQPRRTIATDTRSSLAIQRNSTRKAHSSSTRVSEITFDPMSASGSNCDLKVIDYSIDRIQLTPINSSSLDQSLQKNAKPSWASCRWIYVNGLDAEVIRHIGESHALHQLAIEDVLDTRTPTKVDWYHDHCFIVMTLQKLIDYDRRQTNIVGHRKVAANAPSIESVRSSTSTAPKNRRWRPFAHLQLEMSVEQVSIFLTADNTLVTIFESSGDDILQTILTRLESPQTMIRASDDPSMLMQAVIDGVVDLALPLGHALSEGFHDLEEAVLSSPAVSQSTQLYVLRSGLAHLMDRMNGINAMVKSLSDHRKIAQPYIKNCPEKPFANSSPEEAQIPTLVRISSTTQMYLRDVQDHVQALSNSLHMLIRSSENLTTLMFNMIAASQNQSMRVLTLVSSFFLPLTFLTGYFGMNFDPMPSVNEHSEIYFWYIAVPIMATTATILLLRALRISMIARRRYLRRDSKLPSRDL